jgi:hypothetical protein
LIKNKTKLEDNNYQELQEFENWLAPLSIIKQKFSNSLILDKKIS